jgi:hypothetical protein
MVSTEQHSNPNSAPKFCPHCGSGADIRLICTWRANSIEDPDNECDLDEYQCHDACEGNSFWA